MSSSAGTSGPAPGMASVLSMLAVDDPQLTHSSHGNTEMEELVVTLLACGSERPGPASADVMRKMIKHVRTTLGKEISSGYDTTTINIDIFRVLTAVVWNDRRCRELAAEEKLEAHNRAHGKGKDAGGGLLGVMNDLMTMHAQILEDATAITATVAPTDAARSATPRAAPARPAAMSADVNRGLYGLLNGNAGARVSLSQS